MLGLLTQQISESKTRGIQNEAEEEYQGGIWSAFYEIMDTPESDLMRGLDALKA